MLYIESAGIPTEEGGRIIYKQNSVMRFTRWYNIFIMLWMVQFVYGCQNMFIAGAVSVWYFTRYEKIAENINHIKNRPFVTIFI